MAWTVAVYLVDLAYGGPEEGGWYYQYGSPAEDHAGRTRGFARQGDAERYANTLNRSVFMEKLNEGRPEIESVASRGIYQAEARQGNPAAWPVQRPHYE